MAILKTQQSQFKIKKLRTIFILYWFLLTYIIAALVFWYIALNEQNGELTRYRLALIDVRSHNYQSNKLAIEDSRKRKTAQYLGEGATFLLLIIAGAAYVFRIIKRQLYQSQQQQNFMMAITHELKTPIAVTKLNLETLQKRKLDEGQQHKLISTTIQETDRLNALCNNMLLTSQIESGSYSLVKEKIDLSELGESCVNNFISRYPQRKIRIVSEPGLYVSGDKTLLELAVNNLLDNALKYSGKDDLVLMKLNRYDLMVEMKISDEGPGVSREERAKIFEKYFRGSARQTKGTGLGLYLTKNIIDQHKGSISVSENKPHGSIFIVLLPGSV
ncbi:MAG: ATP-binding protein [Ginsengibacter sp.]